MNKILYLSLLIFSLQCNKSTDTSPKGNQPLSTTIWGSPKEQKKPFPLRIKKFIQSIGDFCQRFPASCTMMPAPTK